MQWKRDDGLIEVVDGSVSRGRFCVKGTVLLTTFGTKVVRRTVPLTQNRPLDTVTLTPIITRWVGLEPTTSALGVQLRLLLKSRTGFIFKALFH